MLKPAFLVAAIGLAVAMATPVGAAEHAPPAAPAPAAPTDVKPYDPQLLRLAEILGALTYLRGLCGDKDADAWHKRMQTLLDAEGTTAIRKERLAGAFNRGIEGYALSYRTCTVNAHLIIERFLAEGSQIAKEVENRFGAT
ncbi:TIGR02301 family protein [Beijerinckia sp. L45]|uniref:TIGR02301 family protein n=1 Tax=Beijerinckia sp. L45 TaxID=1641855 RepID=UPI001FEF323D|nr:TIGR02301 family protein [Beijerinckia sp. L45]